MAAASLSLQPAAFSTGWGEDADSVSLHGTEATRSEHKSYMVNKQLYKTKVCSLWLQGKCTRRVCRYAHGKADLNEAPNFECTTMCRATQQGRACHDPKCRYAHSFKDLRSTTKMFKSSMCKFHAAGQCWAGERCRHAHSLDELRQSKSWGGEVSRSSSPRAESSCSTNISAMSFSRQASPDSTGSTEPSSECPTPPVVAGGAFIPAAAGFAVRFVGCESGAYVSAQPVSYPSSAFVSAPIPVVGRLASAPCFVMAPAQQPVMGFAYAARAGTAPAAAPAMATSAGHVAPTPQQSCSEAVAPVAQPTLPWLGAHGPITWAGSTSGNQTVDNIAREMHARMLEAAMPECYED